MEYILAYNEIDLSSKGFYVEGIHDDIPSPSIRVDSELWAYLVDLRSPFKLVEDFNFSNPEIFNIQHTHLFEVIEIPQEVLPQEPSVMDRVNMLEEENAQLLLDSAIKDSKISMLENDIADVMFEIAIMRSGGM